MSNPVAGWYADPEDPAQERWWNGSSWSDSRRPSTQVAVPPVPPAPAGEVPPIPTPPADVVAENGASPSAAEPSTADAAPADTPAFVAPGAASTPAPAATPSSPSPADAPATPSPATPSPADAPAAAPSAPRPDPYATPVPPPPAPYAANPYAQPYGAQQPVSTINGFALAGLITSLSTIILGWFIGPIPAIVGTILSGVGMAKAKQREAQGLPSGRGLAIGGLITGIAFIVITVLIIVLFFALFYWSMAAYSGF